MTGMVSKRENKGSKETENGRGSDGRAEGGWRWDSREDT